MIVGLKTKNRKDPYVHLDYIVNLVEIKPWPPSKSLRSLRSALIQWEHGDKSSGSTKIVAPSNVSNLGVGDGKIEFNESFTVQVTLSRDMSMKAGDNETFLRNYIEFNMYEPRWDKTLKGQLLGTAVMDFAEYGIVQESLMISVPINCKRVFGNTVQPMLFVKIQMIEENKCLRPSFSESFVRKGSITESVSALMNEEYAEEADTATITDDDISSQSSMAAACSSTLGSNGNSMPQRENGSEAMCRSSRKVNDQEVSVQDKRAVYEERISSSSSKDLYSELENARTTLSNLHNSRSIVHPQKAEFYSMKLSKSSIANDKTSKDTNTNSRNNSFYAKLHENDTIKAAESQISGVDDDLSRIQLEKLHSYQNGRESQFIRDFGFVSDRLQNMKHAGSSLDSPFSNGSVRTSKIIEKPKNDGVHDENSERKDVSKVQHLEQRVQNLENELRESAAIEVSLYSVVAEHGSSINKVHAPARRLSRLYLHACKESFSRRASAARSIVSGLVLVTKACGNDVPRLTFWLSNCVVLRTIIHKTIEIEKGNNEMVSPFKWRKECSLKEWEDPRMVTSVLEKVESWIFSRVIQSIWWQTLAPYMHSAAAKGIIKVIDSESNKTCQTKSDHEQLNTCLEFWKTAFMDACERICPVRATGHDCGCLNVLSMLIMEQCTVRLDVAMFNAILRESGDEVPTDPVSDPISDVRVLPIPSGKASFGAGAQLKKTIGNWSRWLTDLFGSPISFHLLGALSELMMLPKDMLLSNTIRKEVCPTIGVALIKRIIDSFVPDEFCPDPIPEVVLEALNSEDLLESSEDCVTSVPCAAAHIVYHPPSASLIGCILEDNGNRSQLSRNKSSILRKSNTSDDELDELDSPLTLIDDSSSVTKPVWSSNTIRYQLLKEVWMNSD